MKVNIVKAHHAYDLGEVEVDAERGAYLLRTGVAEEVPEKKEQTGEKEKQERDKTSEKKEKKEIKKP